MAIVINGDGSISGISVGGLPDGVVDSGTLATDSVNSAELVNGAIDSGHLASGVGGKIVQVVYNQEATVYTTTDLVPHDDTIPTTSEGIAITGLDTAITPTNSSNLLKIECNLFVNHSSGAWIITHLHQDSGANAIAVTDEFCTGGHQGTFEQITFYMTAGTTSATTFNLYCGSQNPGTTTIGGASGNRLYGGVGLSTLSITEIAV